jgi:hypothetical protein
MNQQDALDLIMGIREPKKAPDAEIAPVWVKLSDFEKRWYVAFKRSLSWREQKTIKALTSLAGLDATKWTSDANRESYLFKTDLINVAKATYWEYIRQHSEHKDMKKAKRKRKIKHDPDTCQRELDWDASYWFSDRVIDLAEMRGRTNYEDYSQKPGWWPV